MSPSASSSISGLTEATSEVVNICCRFSLVNRASEHRAPAVPRTATSRVRRPLPQHAESLIHQINTLMQTRRRQTDTLAHHSNGLHIPPGRNEAVHLRLHLNREPVPQSTPIPASNPTGRTQERPRPFEPPPYQTAPPGQISLW